MIEAKIYRDSCLKHKQPVTINHVASNLYYSKDDCPFCTLEGLKAKDDAMSSCSVEAIGIDLRAISDSLSSSCATLDTCAQCGADPALHCTAGRNKGREPMRGDGQDMTDKEFVDDMRTFRVDHLPDGWPAVQMHQIDRLIEIIDVLIRERDEAKKTGGYTCHVCGALRMECDIMKRSSDDATERTARRCAEIAHNWRDEKTGISCCHRLDIEAEIRAEFGLSD